MENPANIIFVEDNPSDVRLFDYALSQVSTDIKMTHYEHGRTFLENLSTHYPTTINCILLDINMPFVTGWEVMEQIKKLENYKHIPIIIFTSSNSNEDKQRAYELGANAYVSKPNEIEDLCIVIERIVDFWVNTNGRIM